VFVLKPTLFIISYYQVLSYQLEWFDIYPQNSDFVIVSGAKRKAEPEEYDPDSGLVRIAEDEEKQQLEDPFHKVSHYLPLHPLHPLHPLILTFSHIHIAVYVTVRTSSR
jgi:hypothetical protein